MNDRIRYHILKKVQDNPKITQRELAQSLGISLGKINYCLHALISEGLVKADNYSKSQNKPAYLYSLTHRGLEEKLRVSKRFLQVKLKEYDLIRQEIEELRKEICPGIVCGIQE
ncbi:MAG: MarR family EPS-associated transcriptional regulator [Desulfohalobiaceae bacterium]|nr:MarR family EPS-associated transcriptional regulator [Desulfohalobiaceae bacterium]